jgi:hypothetical protein
MADRSLTAAEHREVARILHMMATENADRDVRQRIMLKAIEHEAAAEELARLEIE